MHILPWYGTKYIIGSILFLIIFYYAPIPSFLPFVALEIYFSLASEESELVLPKNLDLQKKKLQRGPWKDIDFFSKEFEG